MASFPLPDVRAALAHPTDRAVDAQGFASVTTSAAWKLACAPLPSCAALQWPGYATTCIETQLDGVDVVIQPWMGHCQELLGRASFPGGYGGEVGVYVKIGRSRPLPDSEILPAWARGVFEGVAQLGADHLWWPDASVQPEIDFTIINPLDHSVLVRAAPERNYWVNRWMEPESYARYQAAHPTPSPTGYKMVFTVGGVTRAWTPAPEQP